MSILDWFTGKYTPDVLSAILAITATQPAVVEEPVEPPPIPQEQSQLSCVDLFSGKHMIVAKGYKSAKFIGDNTWVIVYPSGASEAVVTEPGVSCYRVREDLE